MELLAPAGCREALEAAVRGGADAVYLGLNILNARRGAGNFDPAELVSACGYCHERDVNVYVTLNILVMEGELKELEGAARVLAKAGADAAIVQDLGAARALGQMLPGLSLHASTQMAIHNPQGVRFLKRLGFDRAILAREMSYQEIRRAAGQGLDLEVFGHGALCVSCSGQCLFSSMLGGRSGNRGLCAQPCRLPYRLLGPLCDGAGDLLSPKDLCTIGDLEALESAGVSSLKLEGRLKSPDYVYKVTNLYRRALDGEKVDARLLDQVFNRGYTRGYGPGVDDSELMSVPGEKHVQRDEGEWPPAPERTIPLAARLLARAGQPLTLTLSDGTHGVCQTGAPVEKARKPTDPARMAAQLAKTGGTPYRMETIDIDGDSDAHVPVSAVNALRRSGLEALGELRGERDRPLEFLPLALPDRALRTPEGRPLLCVESRDASLLTKALDWGAEEILWTPRDVTEPDNAPAAPFTLCLPPALDGEDLDRLNGWALEQEGRMTGTVLNNPAHLAMNWPGQVRAGLWLNVCNSLTVQALTMPYMPSPELTAAAIRALSGEKELLVYGRIPLMLLRHCPLNHALGGGLHAACRRCDRVREGIEAYELIDRKEASFPFTRLKTGSGCILTLHNSVPLMLLRHSGRIPPAARWRILFSDETEELCRDVVECHRTVLDGQKPSGAAWDRLSAVPSTTGHYFRGVD